MFSAIRNSSILKLAQRSRRCKHTRERTYIQLRKPVQRSADLDCRRGLLGVQILHDSLGLRSRHQQAQFLEPNLTQMGDAAISSQEFFCGALAHARNFQQGAAHLPLTAAELMKSYREAMCLVANLLDQVQNRRVSLEFDGFVFLSEHINYFFFFGNACQRLVDDLQFLERCCRGMQLPDSAVNQYEAWQRFILGPQAAVAPFDCFLQARKVVALPWCGSAANNKLAII